MSVEEAVFKLRQLPSEKQQEVLNLIEELCREAGEKRPLRSLHGLWADLGVDITEEDIADVRREMWGGRGRPSSKDERRPC